MSATTGRTTMWSASMRHRVIRRIDSASFSSGCDGKAFGACTLNLARSIVAAVYETHGQPEAALQLVERDLDDPAAEEVVVEWLAAPINPSDINQIEGKYPIRPQLPAVAGNEGVGVVRRGGSKISSLQPGDRVVAALPGQGTWSEAGVYAAGALRKVSRQLRVAQAACLAINPVTAIRLLEEGGPLQEGDVVIQNGANSAVGQLVIQVAAARKVRTVNLVRDRPNLEELVRELESLGADLVTTEASLRKDFGRLKLPKPRLALNCVGGSACAAIAGLLGEGGSLVTYGGMSKQPVVIPTGSFIFKGIQARGFWLSGGAGERKLEDISRDIGRAEDMFLKKQLRHEVELYDLEDLRVALEAPTSGTLAKKRVLVTAKGREAIEQESSRS